MNGALFPWQRIEISGPSMVPTLRPGDRVVVRHGARVRPGDIVLARFPSLPDRMVVKRAARRVDGGWWLVSDNPFAGSDSETYGPAEIFARAIVRLGPGLPRVLRRS